MCVVFSASEASLLSLITTTELWGPVSRALTPDGTYLEPRLNKLKTRPLFSHVKLGLIALVCAGLGPGFDWARIVCKMQQRKHNCEYEKGKAFTDSTCIMANCQTQTIEV